MVEADSGVLVTCFFLNTPNVKFQKKNRTTKIMAKRIIINTMFG